MDHSPVSEAPFENVGARLSDALARGDTADAAVILRDHMYEIWCEHGDLLGRALGALTETDYTAHPALALSRDSAGLQSGTDVPPAPRRAMEEILPTLSPALQTQFVYLEMAVARWTGDGTRALELGKDLRRRLRSMRSLHVPRRFDPVPVWMNQLAITEALYGDTSTAIADLQESVRLNPADNVDPCRSHNRAILAVVLALRGQVTEARTALDQCEISEAWGPVPRDFVVRVAEIAAALIATEAMAPDAEETLAAARRPIVAVADEFWPMLLLAEGRYALAHHRPAHVLELAATTAAMGPFPEHGLVTDVVASLTANAFIDLGDLAAADRALAGDRAGWFVRVARLRMLLARRSYRQLHADARRVLTTPNAPLVQRAESMLLGAWADQQQRGRVDATTALHVCELVTQNELRRPLSTVPQELLTALAEVLPAARAGRFTDAFANLPAYSPAAGREPLTERESAVLAALADESSMTELGKQLFLSPNTVKTHLRSIYRKLDVQSRQQALDEAVHLGILPGERPGPH